MDAEQDARHAEINRLKGIVAIATVSLVSFGAVFGGGLLASRDADAAAATPTSATVTPLDPDPSPAPAATLPPTP